MSGLTVDPGTLVFFLDETGHEALSDPNYPIFGFGGCAAMAENCEWDLFRPWRVYKSNHLGGPDVRYHTVEQRALTPTQINARNDFFRKESFVRFAAVMKITTVVPSPLTPFQLIAADIQERVRVLASRSPCRKIVRIFEESQRTKRLIEMYFGDVKLRDETGREVPIEDYFMPKSAGSPGLDVADFIIHTAGVQVKDRWQGKAGWREEFKAVFQPARPELSSYIEIDIATLSPPSS